MTELHHHERAVSFFLILLGMIWCYLVLVEPAKSRFYATQSHPARSRPSGADRLEHRVRRYAHRFTHHDSPASR